MRRRRGGRRRREGEDEVETVLTRNLNEDTTFLMVEEGDLSGVPEDLVKSFERDEQGRCKVATIHCTSHVFAFDVFLSF